MRRRVLTFMLVPAFGGFFATVLFLAQGGFGAGHGRGDPLVLFLGLPSILLWLPACEILPLPRVIEDHDFLLIIAVPALMNLGLFALAGFISWMWFPPRTVSPPTGASDRLSRAREAIEDVTSLAIQSLSCAKGENIINTEGVSQAQTLRPACEQAQPMNAPGKELDSSGEQFLFAILWICLGHLCEALFGWFLLVVYGFASMNGPGSGGVPGLVLTLKKMLDPRDALWGTLLFAIGSLGGLFLVFTGCVRLSQAAGEKTSPIKVAMEERPSAP